MISHVLKHGIVHRFHDFQGGFEIRVKNKLHTDRAAVGSGQGLIQLVGGPHVGAGGISFAHPRLLAGDLTER